MSFSSIDHVNPSTSVLIFAFPLSFPSRLFPTLSQCQALTNCSDSNSFRAGSMVLKLESFDDAITTKAAACKNNQQEIRDRQRRRKMTYQGQTYQDNTRKERNGRQERESKVNEWRQFSVQMTREMVRSHNAKEGRNGKWKKTEAAMPSKCSHRKMGERRV